MDMLNVSNLSVHYEGIAAVQSVSLRVEEQEAVVLIGANGAGKSSLLRAILGLIPSSADSLSVGGEDVQKQQPHARIACGLSLVPESRALFHRMTVEDNLKLGLFLNRQESLFQNELDRVASLFPILKVRLKQVAGTLSGGEQQMLALGRALMQRPRLLCLDEPSLGLAPKLVEELYVALETIRNDGTGILLVEQLARRALGFGSRGYVMHLGKIVKEGRCEDLKQDDFVKSAYMGGVLA